jgi:hypothetical protein
MKARGRQHRRQRLCCCTLKRGGLIDFAIIDFFAKFFFSPV